MQTYIHQGYIPVNNPIQMPPPMDWFEYCAKKEGYTVVDTLDWSKYTSPVQSIEQDDASMFINFEDGLWLSLWVTKEDQRTVAEMSTEKCYAEPDGCCFEHSTCGDPKCLEHDPLQDLKFECQTFDMIGKRIVSFQVEKPEEYMISSHDFFFVLESGDRVAFTISNYLSVPWSYGFDLVLCSC
jgi:hypothetical protein